VKVRLAKLSDSEAVRAIYNHAVTTSTATFDLVPRSADEQRRWLSARGGAHAVVVAEDDSGEVPVIAGFGSLSPYRSRPAYTTSVEDSVYVREDYQGKGVGKSLLAELIRLATAHGFHAMFARIAEGHDGHEASLRLHAALGFELVGTEREVGRKFGRWIDVVVMQRLL
jgi:L-amino acid N-acyltransferase YncA